MPSATHAEFHELATVRHNLVTALPLTGSEYVLLLLHELRNILDLAAGHVICAIRKEASDSWIPTRVAVHSWAGTDPEKDLRGYLSRAPSFSDPFFRKKLSGDEPIRIVLRQDVCDDDEWSNSPVLELMRANNVEERAILACRISDVCQIRFGLDRTLTQGPFTERDRCILSTLGSGLFIYAWRASLLMGITRGNKPLAPRERDVLSCLVTGLDNDAIARRLKIAVSTVQRYNSTIYETLGVSGRTEVMAMWAGTERHLANLY